MHGKPTWASDYAVDDLLGALQQPDVIGLLDPFLGEAAKV